MRLNNLHLQNFQVHEDLNLPLSPGITTIMGPTDRGKSAVLRALEWAALNSMGGDAFVRHGSKETTVTLTVGDRTVVRSKGGRSNVYALDGSEFRALGVGGVPQDVADLLRVGELNFQGQHDSPFWFAESAGEVSRQLNAIVDLGAIDTALERVAAAGREAAAEERVVASRMESLTAEVGELRAKQGRVRAFRALRQQQQDVENLRGEVEWLQDVLSLAAQSSKAEARYKARQGILMLAEGVWTIRQQKTRLAQSLAQSKRFQAVQSPPDFAPVEALHRKWREASTNRARLEEVLDAAVRADLTVGLTEKAAAEATQSFQKQTKGKPCPLCGNPIS